MRSDNRDPAIPEYWNKALEECRIREESCLSRGGRKPVFVFTKVGKLPRLCN